MKPHIISTPTTHHQQGCTLQQQGADWMKEPRHEYAGYIVCQIGKQMMEDAKAPAKSLAKSSTNPRYDWTVIATVFFEYVTGPLPEVVFNWVVQLF